jgi:hypothetical protein
MEKHSHFFPQQTVTKIKLSTDTWSGIMVSQLREDSSTATAEKQEKNVLAIWPPLEHK